MTWALAVVVAVSLVASVGIVCLATLRAIGMRLAHEERTRDLDEDDALERRISALEDAGDRRDQEVRDVRSSLSLKRLG